MKNIHIRKYKQADVEEVKYLMNELGYSVKIMELSTNISAIRENGGEVLVADDGKNVIGCVCVLIDARLAEGVYAEIVSLVVSEKQRGKGIGKILIKNAEKWAGNKVDKIRVRANIVRSGAHLFYKSLSYKEIKTQKIFMKMV
jgi:N-acetylglutamate synthase-like GNAT family acetyltransferase